MSDAPLPDAVQEIEAAHRAWVVAGDNPGSEFTRLADLYFRFGPALIAELQSAWAENERLRAALRPFGEAMLSDQAKALNTFPDHFAPLVFWREKRPLLAITLGDFRRACDALQETDNAA